MLAPSGWLVKAALAVKPNAVPAMPSTAACATPTSIRADIAAAVVAIHRAIDLGVFVVVTFMVLISYLTTISVIMPPKFSASFDKWSRFVLYRKYVPIGVLLASRITST